METKPNGINNKLKGLSELRNDKDFLISELKSEVKTLKQENQYLKHKCDRESELVIELERNMKLIIEENQVHTFTKY